MGKTANNTIDRLLEVYGEDIALPWPASRAPEQGVLFCVYPPRLERNLRFRIGDFEAVTRNAGHGWNFFDMTETFASWLGGQRYAERYFQNPAFLKNNLSKYLEFVQKSIETAAASSGHGEGDVFALLGAGALFGLARLQPVVAHIASKIPGRLVVFFPGVCDGSSYRLLDAYDGFNYHARVLTAAM